MGLDGPLTDDYIAELLTRDAKAVSARSASRALGGSTSRRPANAALKPNTRFLRNILRDTDSHNAALLAREAEESRQRLDALREKDRRTRKGKPEQALYSARHRRERDAQPSIKRRRVTDEEEASDSHRRRMENRRDEDANDDSVARRRRRTVSEERRNGTTQTARRHDRRHLEDDEAKHGHSQSTRHKHRHRHRSRSPDETRHIEGREHNRMQRRSVRHRSKSPPQGSRQHRRRSRSGGSADVQHTHHHSRFAERASRQPPPSDSDSDPLDAMIGPLPPSAEPGVSSRGRGAFASKVSMDNHFAPSYDPKADVVPNVDDHDDWDMALEAMRDRQAWRAKGADRLKAAGFTDDEAQRWEKGGSRDEDDVRWSRKGEGREWDRGKVVEEDGAIGLKAEWGRLKGT